MGVGITVERLNAFYGKTQALFDININVLANHATALIGPSGCGKSTFIRCLNRMHETIPEARVEGTVHIGEFSVYNGTSATQLRRRVGMVFQKPNPFPTMSIYDNRSEEHTSELQSLRHLVCRLLLEKKKHKHTTVYPDLTMTMTPDRCRYSTQL